MSIPPWLFDELAERTPDDGELMALASAWAGLLIGAIEEDDGPVADCGCGQRSREWRLRAPGVDVTYVYLSGRAHREAVAEAPTNGRGVVEKGPASGWVYEKILSGCHHAWQCNLCHPPVDGLDVEFRRLTTMATTQGRKRQGPATGADAMPSPTAAEGRGDRGEAPHPGYAP